MSNRADSSKPKAATEPVATKSVSEATLHGLEDRAHLFDLIIESASFISFYTGYDGQGAPLRETLVVKRDHNDNILYNMAMRKAKKLGASSWCVFKPVGVPHNVDYGRYGDESRLDFIETVSDLLVTDPEANKRQAKAQTREGIT